MPPEAKENTTMRTEMLHIGTQALLRRYLGLTPVAIRLGIAAAFVRSALFDK